LKVKQNKHWWIVFSIALCFLWGLAVYLHRITGIGTWGLNKTVGLGISQTLFGGVLVTQEHYFCGIILFRQRWRMAINRSAGNDIFSVIQAGLFPIIHGSSMVSVLGFTNSINLVLFG
jgi:molybdopterin-containing oxidoreductase family membrane subunit